MGKADFANPSSTIYWASPGNSFPMRKTMCLAPRVVYASFIWLKAQELGGYQEVPWQCVLFVIAEYYQVKRTCTDDFDVNFFMVNHACMTEGHRHGHMCFCEEDECNAANAIYRSNWKVTLLSSVLVTFVTLFHTAVLQRWSNKQTNKQTRKLQNIFVPSQRNATN